MTQLSDDASQALSDIKEWFTDHEATSVIANLCNGAGKGDLVRAEDALQSVVPQALRAFYAVHDGERTLDRNSFFPHHIGGFLPLEAAVAASDDLLRWIIPTRTTRPLAVRDGAKIAAHVFHLSEETRLLDSEYSTQWFCFARRNHFATLMHLHTGRVFAWARDVGLRVESESFDAFLMEYADHLWAGKHRIRFDEAKGGWVWI